MTERIFLPGSPQPDARVTKVWRAVSATDGISYLRIVPDLVERLDYCWVREDNWGTGQTWAEINVYALRDVSETDDRPGEQKPPLTLTEATHLIADVMGVDPSEIGAGEQPGEQPGVVVLDMAMIERQFSLAASDPGAYAKRRTYPADGGGVDYEPVSSWVAHACAHVAIATLPQFATFRTAVAAEHAPAAPVTMLTAEQLEDMAVATHRQDCYDSCDVHTMTSYREGVLRALGAAGVLVVNVPPTKVAEIRMRQHRELVSVVTGVPIEELP